MKSGVEKNIIFQHMRQKQEFERLFSNSERVIDFLSHEPAVSAALYKKARELYELPATPDAVQQREQSIVALNLHNLKVCMLGDADGENLHIEHVTRLLPEFFQDPALREKFKNIKQFFCSGLNLFELPEDISVLENVALMFLDRNKFSTLPSSITRLPKLVSINLFQNNFRDFDLPLDEMPSLKFVDVRMNPLSNEKCKNLMQRFQERDVELTTDISTSSSSQHKKK